MISKSQSLLWCSFVWFFAGIFFPSLAIAQFGDFPGPGGPGGFDPGPGGIGDSPTQSTPGQGPGGGGVGGGGGFDPTGQPTEINPAVNQLATTADTRNQGFVGSTSDRIREFGFVGAASPTSGPPLAPGASFGGGNNTGRGARAGGFAGGGGFNNRMGAGFSPFGAQNGFEVFRGGGLRTTWTMNFTTPKVEPAKVVADFNSSYRNLPVSQGSSQGHKIELVDTTAIVTGTVSTREEADRLINQLRLQPGVYKIDNRLEVRQ